MHPASTGVPGSAPAWNPEGFDYDPPVRLEVREGTPRKPYRMSGTRQEQVVFKDLRGQDVPVLITRPEGRDDPLPVVLLVHGFTSNKEEVTRQVGRALLDAGFACLAPDMPMHGERPGPPQKVFPVDDPEQAYRNAVQAVTDIRQTLDFAETRRDLRLDRGVGVIGYSMGAWLGTLAAAADRRVTALCLMVAGSAVTLPTSETWPAPAHETSGAAMTGSGDLVRRYPPLRHELALAKFSPRPVLMQNGKKDLLSPADRVQTLFAAATGPKEIRWYDAGHILPQEACKDAAEWLVKVLQNPKTGR